MTENDHPTKRNSSEAVRLKHLDYIQSIVARMSQSSTQTKSWLLPVVTATFGYALAQQSVTVALLGIAAVLLFGYMDASYLRQERAYRRLYNSVVAGDSIPEFSLDPNDIDRTIPDADGDSTAEGDPSRKAGYWNDLREALRGWLFFDPKVWFSWSISPFYGGFLAVGIAVLWHAVTN